MPAKPNQPPRPTESELAILRVLWKREHATVREVLDELNAGHDDPYAYTSVLSFLQIMMNKGLVTREGDGRGHRYRASVPPERTKRQLVRDFMDRVFNGSASELVAQALGARKVSAEELSEIQKLLSELRKP
jgi:BlaI family transcriptional regulator, penicillinase repressor